MIPNLSAFTSLQWAGSKKHTSEAALQIEFTSTKQRERFQNMPSINYLLIAFMQDDVKRFFLTEPVFDRIEYHQPTRKTYFKAGDLASETGVLLFLKGAQYLYTITPPNPEMNMSRVFTTLWLVNNLFTACETGIINAKGELSVFKEDSMFIETFSYDHAMTLSYITVARNVIASSLVNVTEATLPDGNICRVVRDKNPIPDLPGAISVYQRKF